MPKKKDLSGQRFGRLIVLYETMPHYTSGGNKKIMWHCKCDCGVEKDISSGELLKKKTVSCGCYNNEKNKKSRHKQICTYKFPRDKDYCIGYTFKGDIFIFDKDDYEKVSQYNWHKHHDYYEAWIPMSKPRKSILLHRLIMNVSDIKYDYTEDVDHIKTEHKWDNRKCNLRIVSKYQNNLNRKCNKNNLARYPGVRLTKNKKGKPIWRAVIKIAENKTISRDCNSKEEAILIRKKLETLYFGEYSYSNSQELAKKYEIKEII